MSIEFSKAYPEKDTPPTEKKKPSGKKTTRSIYQAAAEGDDEASSSDSRPRKRKRRRRRRGDSGREESASPQPQVSRSVRRHEGEAARAARESERLHQTRQEKVPESAHFGGKFREFDLSAPVLKAVEDMGWVEPSEIQTLVIPKVLMGRDVVGQARTGTGKTGAFALPLIERYQERPEGDQAKGRAPAALILTPTRELALQIHRQLEQLGAYTRLRAVAVYGGAPMEPQLRAMRAGADFVAGTPGRIMDHIRRKTLRLTNISCFVLDEADRMFDLGFRDDIYWISRRLPDEGRQTLLLSATMPKEVLRLSREVTSDPEEIYTSQGKDSAMTVNTVEQFYVAVDPERKMGLLSHLVQREHPSKGIVFTRTKRGADKVADRLRSKGVDAGEIHSDLRQRRRESILERFREGNLHLLVATDVAARGLDIQGVTHIFNFDVPENPEDYVHRVGRTARMGQSGRAFTFITSRDGQFLTGIEKLINKQVPRFDVDGYRCEATAEEASRREGRSAGTHPMVAKLSPALRAILNKRRGPKPGGGGAGGRRNGGRSDRKGGRGGGGKRGRGRGR